MVEIVEIIIIALIAVCVAFVSTIFGSLVGAVVGWIVGMTPLGTWIIEFLSSIGIENTTMVQLGTTCGFVSGFFSAKTNYKKTL